MIYWLIFLGSCFIFELFFIAKIYKKFYSNFLKEKELNKKLFFVNNHLLFSSLLINFAKENNQEGFDKVVTMIEKNGVTSDIYKDPQKYLDFIQKKLDELNN